MHQSEKFMEVEVAISPIQVCGWTGFGGGSQPVVGDGSSNSSLKYPAGLDSFGVEKDEI